jgi:hypothetical protein
LCIGRENAIRFNTFVLVVDGDGTVVATNDGDVDMDTATSPLAPPIVLAPPIML